MSPRSSEMAKKHRNLFQIALETLKANDCIVSYKIEGHNVRVVWKEGGFTKAFEEYKANKYKAFGLKQKEAIYLVMVLNQEDPKTIDYICSEVERSLELQRKIRSGEIVDDYKKEIPRIIAAAIRRSPLADLISHQPQHNQGDCKGKSEKQRAGAIQPIDPGKGAGATGN